MRIIQNSDEPIYRQISRQFEEQILAGKLKEGDYLPSIRGLAKDLRISVITTMKAYEELEVAGLVTAVQGKGYYVNSQNNEMLKEQHIRKIEDYLTGAITTARVAGMTEDELMDIMRMLIKTIE